MAYPTTVMPTLWEGVVILAVAGLSSGRMDLIMERTELSGELSHILIGGKSEDGSDFCGVGGGLGYSGIGQWRCKAILTNNLRLIYNDDSERCCGIESF